MTKPVRIQLSRKKGFRLQEVSKAINGLEAVKIARPAFFGNPYTLKDYTREECLEKFRVLFSTEHGKGIAKFYLKGKNLACFCKLSDECHGDILLQIANED